MTELEMEGINKILEEHKKEEGNIVTLLQAIQEYYSYLPPHVLFFIAKKLEIPIAEFYSVATFYTQFSFIPKGKYVITVCDGTACHIKNSPLLISFLENELNIKDGETTEDEMFSLESVACLGCCAIAPACVINEEVFGNLTLKKMKKILKQYKKKVEEEQQ
ncbi:MAG: NADH-quinone oxidoreductase subunit NuoE [archaeon]|nr:NADH-quinone oxidoreductase subunit NuoE [archaeon]